MQSRNWYIFSSRANRLGKVLATLAKRRMEFYCPSQKVKKEGWDGVKKLYNIPLFDSKIFIKIMEEEINKIKKITGFQGFLYWLDKPAIISNEDILTIKKALASNDYVYLEKATVNKEMIDESNYSTINNCPKILLSSIGFFIVPVIKEIKKEIAPTYLEKQSIEIIPQYLIGFE